MSRRNLIPTDEALSLLSSSLRLDLPKRVIAGEHSRYTGDALVELLADKHVLAVETIRRRLDLDHIPRLQDSRVVELDRRSGAIRPTCAIDELQPQWDEFREGGEVDG